MTRRIAYSILFLFCVNAGVTQAIGGDFEVKIASPTANQLYTYSSAINVAMSGTVEDPVDGFPPPVETMYINVYRYNSVTNSWSLIANYAITPTVTGSKLSWSQNFTPPQPVGGMATDQYGFNVTYSDSASATRYFRVRRTN